jgi:oligoribonuclease (3'-5' exoribonuclease)
MRFISVDIETSGLSSQNCQILEIGAVFDDLSNPKPIDKLPRFHTYVLNGQIKGEPYALSMHSTIFRRIATLEKPYSYLEVKDVTQAFIDWINIVCPDTKGEDSWKNISVAGKNYVTFDKVFLDQSIPEWKQRVRFSRRVIDPAILYWNEFDKILPDMETCMKRAGISGEVEHNSIADAIVVIKLIRNKLLKYKVK